MENIKGLCVTCVCDDGCSFRKKFPVIYCEEFSCEAPKEEKGKNKGSRG